MIKCQSCGSENIDGAGYCDQCGTKMPAEPVYVEPAYAEPAPVNVEPAARIEPFEIEPAKDFMTVQPETYSSYPEAPVFQSASVTSVGVPQYVEELEPVAAPVSEPEINAGNKGVHAVLIIERGNSIGREFPLAAQESYIGRWDADNGVFPDVDLDTDDPEAKVSRRHARILLQNGNYLLEDLGSTNGTYINRGRRLLPGMPQPLTDNDEIIIGKTFLRFRINQ